MSLHKKALIAFVVLIFGIAGLITYAQYTFEEWIELRYHQHLDTEFVIEADTLNIIDYSVLQDNFTLSDGQNISAEIVNREIDK